MPVLGKCKLFESTNKTSREAIDKEREKEKERAATRKKQERYDDVHRWITIPTGLPFMRETSPSAGTANNPISELRLAASDEPLSDYRRSHIDRLRWHGVEWRRRSLESIIASSLDPPIDVIIVHSVVRIFAYTHEIFFFVDYYYYLSMNRLWWRLKTFMIKQLD